jgi:plasmid maintenance system antidote protein VapI
VTIRITTRTDLAAAIRREWISSGVTLAEIGQHMGGTSPQAVSNLLSGRRGLLLSTAIKLANAVGYDLALVPKKTS